MTNKLLLDSIAATAKYLSENINQMWPDEIATQVSYLKSLMEKL